MAKLHRKDLKRPDQFISWSMKVGQWARDRQRTVAFAGGGVLVVAFGIALTIHLTQRARVNASEELYVALDTLHSPLTADLEEEERPDGEKALPPPGYKTYRSDAERAKAAVKVLKTVVEQRAGSAPGQAGYLTLASTYYSLREYTKARQAYEQFLSDTRGMDHLKAVAIEGVGYCLEANENYDRALAKYRELEKLDNGAHRDLAQYHQARMLEKLNKNDAAADLYRSVVRRAEQATEGTASNLFVRDRAEARLAAIDPGADVLKQAAKRRSEELLKALRSGGGLNLGGGAPPGGEPE